ncbi:MULTISPECIES: DUF1878 family protein [Klebsiella]|uniref:DUF1878 family protein n=1 Tax=Klebsiella TaxID=570 RepID=UPI0009BC2D86|nr:MULTISPECIES: DUF1878 family protein [Klebsiella]QLW87731.1 DUF1878 family protein [Klebsiella oxytoca]HCU0382660.1 DUF1878 family protein [Klebsiella pneumoniae]MBC4642292.1 DUF1878 family protein [Klebsiella quasipneumoniae]MBC4694218.1 DUF1878 family protein [Klebsiella quasipneumoniae]MBC4721474.1 DUF1878 family protein [Klebsiella quasipneumoniae]
MNIEEILEKIKKLEYQISILSECIDYDRYPVQSLILSLGWDSTQINKAHDIFQNFDEKLEKGEKINWYEFENALEDEFSIGYQTVKSIVLAFYNNHQWVDVCYGYAMSFEPTTPIEFHPITRKQIK